MTVKIFIDYDKNGAIEPALDMLDAIVENGKARSAAGRIVEVEDGLADGLLTVLEAMDVEIEVWPLPETPLEKTLRSGLLTANEALASEGLGALPEIGVDFGSPAGDQTWVSEIDGLPVEDPLEQPEETNENAAFRPCEICGERFEPKRKDSRLCGKPECKKEDTRRRNQAEHKKYKAAVAEAAQSSNDESAAEEAEPPFVEKDPRAIWTVKDSSLAPMTMKELQDHLIDKTIKPGTILIRMNSSFPWIVYEDETRLHVGEVDGLAQGSETTH